MIARALSGGWLVALLALSLVNAGTGCFSPGSFGTDGGTGGASSGRGGDGAAGGWLGREGTVGSGGSGGDPAGSGGGGTSTAASGGQTAAPGGRGVGGGGGTSVGNGGTAATGGGAATGGRSASGGAGTGGAPAATGGAPAGTGGATPSDAGAPDVRVCVAEQCNGRDDDCDGIIDDGCPVSQEVLSTRTVSSTSPVYGSLTQVRNLKFNDSCPDGMAIVGFTGNSGSSLDAVGVRCGTLQVSEDRTVEPFRYRVAVGMGIDFSPSGGTLGTKNLIDSLLLCPPNQVVVAVTATTEPPGGMCADNGCPDDTGNAMGCPALYGLAVSCAAYNITGTPGAFRLSAASAPVMSMKAGGPSSGETLVSTYACSASGALRQASGTFGPWAKKCSTTVVTGMQFGCTDPTIPLR